jgi:purine-binding chemotaxis protein CheW
MAVADEAQYVTLGLGAEVFAVPVEHVREILDFHPPFAIPEGPAYLLGLTDVRGRGVATIDLRTKLGLPPVPATPSTRILVVDAPIEGRMLSLGLVADRVIEVVSIPRASIEPAPDIGVRWRSEYIHGVVRRENGFVVLFEIGRLLTSNETALMPGAEPAAA